MIVKVEEILSNTFLNIETVQGQNPIWFHYGDNKELDSILQQKEGQKKYPLLWYVMPNRLNYENGSAMGTFTFILAHKTRLDWNNDQRFNKTFNEVLFPYMENMLKCMERSKNVSYSSLTPYSFTNFPNYGNESSTKAKQIDFWDAIKIDIDDLKIYNDYNC